MQLSRHLITVLAFVACSAWSQSAPTELDAKKVIQGMLGNCRYLMLDNFERVNGIRKGESAYQVEIKYTLKVMPIPENVRVIGELAPKLSEVDERLKQATSERREIKEKMSAISDKASKEYKDLYKRSWAVGPAADKIEREKRDLIKNSISPTATFAKECPDLNRVIYANTFSDEGVDQFAKRFTKTFGGNLMMVKTDKGWMATN